MIEFRFYEELNDFLRVDRRKRSFLVGCRRNTTVKQAIEALGVPHTEVELILVDGESVDFTHLLTDGERVTVYPKFEAFDMSSLLRVRSRVLRRTRFLADAHLGGLAKHLRLLGFDTLYFRQCDDSDLAELSSRDERVLLTRDRDLLKRRLVTHGCYVRAKKVRDQLAEVLSRLDLFNAIAPFSRCLKCNEPIREIAPEHAKRQLPPHVATKYQQFWHCARCTRVYWQGPHFTRMQQLVEEIVLCHQEAKRKRPAPTEPGGALGDD